MDIDKMHKVFRVLAQQMGMQQVRGILPESIDIFINEAIQTKVRVALQQGVRTVYQEQVDTQARSIEPINLLRTLYRNYEYDCDAYKNFIRKINGVSGKDIGRFNIQLPSTCNKISADELKSKVNYLNIILQNAGRALELSDTAITDECIRLCDTNAIINLYNFNIGKSAITPMMYLGFRIRYKSQDLENSDYVASRLIGSDVLDTTLRDFCNGADKFNPISVILHDGEHEYIDLYTNTQNLELDKIEIRYIASPKEVVWNVNEKQRVDCDLPDYCHYEIVQMAVQMYFQAIGATTPKSDNNNNNNNN